jgi:hypothetical protein
MKIYMVEGSEHPGYGDSSDDEDFKILADAGVREIFYFYETGYYEGRGSLIALMPDYTLTWVTVAVTDP